MKFIKKPANKFEKGHCYSIGCFYYCERNSGDICTSMCQVKVCDNYYPYKD